MQNQAPFLDVRSFEVEEAQLGQEIQHEFNLHVADLLFAPSEVEQEAEVAQALWGSRHRPFTPSPS